MDFVNPFIEQVKELYREMSPGSRIIAGLLAIVIVASIAYLFQGGMFEQDTGLLSGAPVDPADQKAILAAFAKEGLDDYQVIGSQIMIPRSKRVDYIAAMVKHNAVPPDFHEGIEQAIQNASPFESQQHRQDRNQVAREKDLALVLRHMPGIEYATVNYDVQDLGGFPRKKEHTASVVVRPTGGQEIDENLVKSIRNYVAHSIAGLQSEKVSVLDLNSRRTYAGTEISVADDPYAARKKWFEKDWEQTIRETLAYIQGVSVTANVELDTTLNQSTQDLKYDTRPVALNTTGDKRTEVIKAPGPAGQPGLQAQGANQPTQLSSSTIETSIEEQREEQKSVAGKTLTTTQLASLVPKKVKVSVTIPSDYYLAVWRSNNALSGGQATAPPPGELKKIEEETIVKVQKAVVTLLPPLPAGDDPFPQVNVTTAPKLPEKPIEEPAFADTALVWLSSNWQSLGMIAVGLFALMMLRSMVNAKPQQSVATKEEVKLELPPGVDEDDELSMDGMLKKRFNQTGPNLKDELVDMVREDPDTAASILQSWIGAA